jgi:hypothetical protein
VSGGAPAPTLPAPALPAPALAASAAAPSPAGPAGGPAAGAGVAAALAGLPRPARRLLALALLALPPLLCWWLLLGPWLEARGALSARLAAAAAAEARAAAVAARRPGLEAELAALRAALAELAEAAAAGGAAGDAAGGAAGGAAAAAAGGGSRHALAGAELQRRLREAAARYGGAVASLETLPEGRAGEAGLVAVRARLQAEAAGLRDLLAELETGRAPLRVEALSVAPAPAGRAGAGRQPLEVQLELHGLLGGPGAGGAGAGGAGAGGAGAGGAGAGGAGAGGAGAGGAGAAGDGP